MNEWHDQVVVLTHGVFEFVFIIFTSDLWELKHFAASREEGQMHFATKAIDSKMIHNQSYSFDIDSSDSRVGPQFGLPR